LKSKIVLNSRKSPQTFSNSMIVYLFSHCHYVELLKYRVMKCWQLIRKLTNVPYLIYLTHILFRNHTAIKKVNRTRHLGLVNHTKTIQKQFENHLKIIGNFRNDLKPFKNYIIS
jgi:hypothetical protein